MLTRVAPFFHSGAVPQLERRDASVSWPIALALSFLLAVWGEEEILGVLTYYFLGLRR